MQSSLSIPCLKSTRSEGTDSNFHAARIPKALVIMDKLLKATLFEVCAEKFTQEAKQHTRVYFHSDTNYPSDTFKSTDAKNELRSPKLRENFLLTRDRLKALLNFVNWIHHHIPFPTTYLPLGGKNSNPCY